MSGLSIFDTALPTHCNIYQEFGLGDKLEFLHFWLMVLNCCGLEIWHIEYSKYRLSFRGSQYSEKHWNISDWYYFYFICKELIITLFTIHRFLFPYFQSLNIFYFCPFLLHFILMSMEKDIPYHVNFAICTNSSLLQLLFSHNSKCSWRLSLVDLRKLEREVQTLIK